MSNYDLIIIGSGIVGSSASFYASKIKKKVLIIEKNFAGFNSSGNAQGGLAPLISDNEQDLKFHLEALDLHRELMEEFRLTNFNPFYTIKPHLKVAMNLSDRDVFKKTTIPNSKFLESGQILKIEPKLKSVDYGGILFNDYLEVDSFNLTNALKERSLEFGAKYINFDFKFNNLITKNNKFIGINLDGKIIYSEKIVFTTGPWTKNLLKNVLSVEVEPLKGQILRTKSKDQLDVSVAWGKDYATKKNDGLLWIGTTEEFVGYDSRPDSKGKEAILNSFQDMFSGFEDMEIIMQTACLRPYSLDNKPIIKESDLIKGVFVGTGAGRNGIKLGPLMGKNLVNLATE